MQASTLLWTDSPRKKFTKSAKDLCFIICAEVQQVNKYSDKH